jgi:hypothetical protein
MSDLFHPGFILTYGVAGGFQQINSLLTGTRAFQIAS